MSLGARSRRKGHAYERELARRFGDEAGCPAVRNLEEVRSGNSGDLVFTHGDPLCVQAKVGGRPSVWNAVKEAEEAAGPRRPSGRHRKAQRVGFQASGRTRLYAARRLPGARRPAERWGGVVR